MTLADIVESSGWKNFMKYLYGWGAAIVLIGAMFKLMHWPGASAMLVVGLSVEAVIFFFSAFEPLHEDVDWSLVYPELAGMEDEEDIKSYKDSAKDPALIKKETAQAVQGGGGSSASLSVNASLPALDEQSVDQLKQGMENLKNSVVNLADISDASIATKAYFESLKQASDKMNSFNETMETSTNNLKDSSAALVDSYSNTAGSLNKSGNELIQTYETLTKSMLDEQESISANSKNYGNNLSSLNKNLDALNAAYEMQLQNNNDYLKSSKEIYSGLDKMTNGLKESVDETLQYKDELNKLNQNLSALNNIYGNMLSAVSILNK
jgi:gliding motility-associated protein GldL